MVSLVADSMDELRVSRPVPSTQESLTQLAKGCVRSSRAAQIHDLSAQLQHTSTKQFPWSGWLAIPPTPPRRVMSTLDSSTSSPWQIFTPYQMSRHQSVLWSSGYDLSLWYSSLPGSPGVTHTPTSDTARVRFTAEPVVLVLQGLGFRFFSFSFFFSLLALSL
jgi:hypothetical protein